MVILNARSLVLPAGYRDVQLKLEILAVVFANVGSTVNSTEDYD